jgi:hypothetical protein
MAKNGVGHVSFAFKRVPAEECGVRDRVGSFIA